MPSAALPQHSKKTSEPSDVSHTHLEATATAGQIPHTGLVVVVGFSVIPTALLFFFSPSKQMYV